MYDMSNTPDKQALADVMIMLCIRSAEIKNLRISNRGVTGYAKNWGQQDIPRVFRSLESKANTYVSEALWHFPDSYSSPSKRYTIVNMRKRGEPYNRARSFQISNEN